MGFFLVSVVYGAWFLWGRDIFNALSIGSSVSESVPGTYTLTIKGDMPCEQETEAALSLLQAKDPHAYGRVMHFMGVIDCSGPPSLMYPWQNPPTFVVSRETFEAGSVWYASVLTHETCHIEQFFKNMAWQGEQAERDCLAAQTDTAKRIGASEETLKYLEQVSETQWWKEGRGQWW